MLTPRTDPPDSITIEEFMSNDQYGRCPLPQSRNPYTCGLTGKTYTALEVQERVELLARSLAQGLDFQPNKGIAWDKVVCIYSLNTVQDPAPFSVLSLTTARSTTSHCIMQFIACRVLLRLPVQRTLTVSLNTNFAHHVPRPSSPVRRF